MKVNLREECRSPLQYTDTSFFQQKERRIHRNQNPMPEIQKQLPPVYRLIPNKVKFQELKRTQG